MANEKHETIADIVAAMRDYSNACNDGYLTDYSVVCTDMRNYADRIEAALGREKATAEKSSVVGNAAAMREVLSDIIDKIDKWRTDGSMEHWQYSQLFDIADTALAAPPRNCDVGTAEEQAKRFLKFCASQDCKRSCPFRKCKDGWTCVMAWAQMPYEEGGAK